MSIMRRIRQRITGWHHRVKDHVGVVNDYIGVLLIIASVTSVLFIYVTNLATEFYSVWGTRFAILIWFLALVRIGLKSRSALAILRLPLLTHLAGIAVVLAFIVALWLPIEFPNLINRGEIANVINRENSYRNMTSEELFEYFTPDAKITLEPKQQRR